MIVERTYWNGRLSGYQLDGSSVPLDRRNSDFQRIRHSIHSGACKVVEPALGAVHRRLDRSGQPSGYATRFGFVPDDQPSHLLRLIRDQIADGSCKVVEPPKSGAVPRFEKLVASLVLAQPWPGLNSECRGELAYQAKPESQKQLYRFTLRNLPDEPIDRINELLKAHNVTLEPRFTYAPHKFGVLEIEIPTERLRSLYFTERIHLPAGTAELVASLAAQNLCESRRSPRDGPDIRWLIQCAYLYTSHFVVEFSNRVIDAFRLEYGRVPVSSTLEGYWREPTAFFGREANGTDHFLGFASLANQQHTPVPAEWFADSLSRYDADAHSSTFLLRTALRRVADLVALGFHAEALAPLNAFLEVLVSESLIYVSGSAHHLAQHVSRMGHAARLKLFAELAEADLLPIWYGEPFMRSLDAARKIYQHRNAYVHNLLLPDVIGRPTLLDRRAMEALFFRFIDFHEQQRVLQRFQSIAQDTGLIRAFIVDKIEASYKAAQLKGAPDDQTFW